MNGFLLDILQNVFSGLILSAILFLIEKLYVYIKKIYKKEVLNINEPNNVYKYALN